MSVVGRKTARRKHEHEEAGELPAEAAAAVFRALVDEFSGAGGAALDWRACVRELFGLEQDSAAASVSSRCWAAAARWGPSPRRASCAGCSS
jgi:hypothetical protein